MSNRLKIRVDSTDHLQLRPAVDVLLDGGVIAGPTQTFYGLMAAADRPEAMARIGRLKGREAGKALLLLLDRPDRVNCYAQSVSPEAQILMKRFWPGPLTILFKARPGIDRLLVGPEGMVALRVEGLAAIRALVRALDRAVTGTSANPSGLPPAERPSQVEDYFGGRIDLIMDGGPCPGGAPSTIVDASAGRPKLVRVGAIDAEEIRAALPDME
jgi:L-threonylcarbamoyladenylate synthase